MTIVVLLLKCRAAERVTTLTRDRVHAITGHVAGYFHDQSGGRELLEFRVFDWFELPMTGAEWNALMFNAGATVVPMVEQGQQVDLLSFGHFVLLIDKQDTNSAAWNAPGPLKSYHRAARSRDPALLAHELDHMYGANHANVDTPAGPAEYGDQLCVMGNEGTTFTFVHPTLGIASGPGTVPPGPATPAATPFAAPGLVHGVHGLHAGVSPFRALSTCVFYPGDCSAGAHHLCLRRLPWLDGRVRSRQR